MTALVHLGDRRVGMLDVAASGRVELRFDDDYATDPSRPVLGRVFEESDLSIRRSFSAQHGGLLSFFRNALPEGALRTWILRQPDRADLSELELLTTLGEDLPGALRVTPTSYVGSPKAGGRDRVVRARRGALRFSLAGVQLKAPVDVANDAQGHVVLPVTGAGGSWIAKFPSALHVELPQNEAAMLGWARSTGIDVPDHKLVPIESIHGLPPGFPADGEALLLRRFDRGVSGARIHQEDFAQVFDLEPEVKYADDDALPDHVCYAGIAAVVARLCGPGAFDELLRRLCFMALSGNMDAHPKNWALLYPDGRIPTLAPAYDLVCTLAYVPVPVLALRWFPSTDPDHAPPGSVTELDVELVRRLARAAGQPQEHAVDLARSVVSDARAAWRRLAPDLRVPELVRKALEQNLDRVPID